MPKSGLRGLVANQLGGICRAQVQILPCPLPTRHARERNPAFAWRLSVIFQRLVLTARASEKTYQSMMQARKEHDDAAFVRLDASGLIAFRSYMAQKCAGVFKECKDRIGYRFLVVKALCIEPDNQYMVIWAVAEYVNAYRRDKVDTSKRFVWSQRSHEFNHAW